MTKKDGSSQAVAKTDPQTDPDMIATFARLAADPKTDIVKLQALIDIYWKVEAKRAETEFNAAMARAQAEIEPVARSTPNPHTRSKYASLDAVYTAIKPIISKHGFGSSFGTTHSEIPNYVRMYCDVTHTGGHSKRYESDLPVDDIGMKGNVNKTPIQAFGSTTSFGRRYMTLMIYDVATMDDNDGNAVESGDTVSDKQVAAIKDKIAKTGGNLARFLEVSKVEQVEDILASKYDETIKFIEDTGKRRAGRTA
jgi:hypothetical protein